MPRFRLQTALNVRSRIEKLKQKALAEQLQSVQKIKEQITLKEESLAQRSEDINQAKTQGFTVLQLQLHDQFKSRVKAEMKTLTKQMREQQQVTQVRQQALVKATQNRKVLEILKQRHQERVRQRQTKLENEQMDEIALNQYQSSRSS